MTVVTRLQLVLWDQDCACDRKWLLENVQGATAIIVMVADKVRVNRSAYQPGDDPTHFFQVDAELLDAGEVSY